MSAPRPVRPHARQLVACVALLLAVRATGVAGASAVLAPPVIDRDAATAGATIAVAPAVQRVGDEDTTTVRVALGLDAPDDLLVTTVASTVEDVVDGRPVAGVALRDATSPAAVRLRPGEAVAVRVSAPPSLPRPARPLVVTVVGRPADDPDGDSAQVQALVLRGAPGSGPRVALTTDDATVQADTALVVAVTVSDAGGTRTRSPLLVTPAAPLRLAVDPAGWPRATTVAVTDERGRVVEATTGGSRLVAVAGVLLVTSTLATVVAARRRGRARRGRAVAED